MQLMFLPPLFPGSNDQELVFPLVPILIMPFLPSQRLWLGLWRRRWRPLPAQHQHARGRGGRWQTGGRVKHVMYVKRKYEHKNAFWMNARFGGKSYVDFLYEPHSNVGNGETTA